MITWKRTPRDFDLSGSSTVQQEIDVSSQPYCYYTDEKIQAQYFDTYVAYSLGEHFWKIEWLRQSGPPPQGDVVYEYKVVVEEVLVEGQEKHKLTASKRSGNPLNITFQPWTLITNDPNVPVNPLYIDPEDQFALHPITELKPYTTNSFTLGNLTAARAQSLAGLYTFKATNPDNTTTTATLDYRVFSPIDSGVPSTVIIKPGSNSSSSVTYHDGFDYLGGSNWTPPSNGEYYSYRGINIPGSPEPIPAGTPFPDSTKFWNGTTDGLSKTISVGLHTFTLVGTIPTPGGSSTYCKRVFNVDVKPLDDDEKENEKKKDKCQPKGSVNARGQGYKEIPLGSPGNSNVDQSVSIINRTANSQSPPQSLGYGWSLSVSERVIEQSSSRVAILMKGDQRVTWVENTFNPNVFLPLMRNFAGELERNSGDGTYLWTDISGNKRKYSAPGTVLNGQILWKEDRNGNRLHYHYNSNGVLTATSDLLTGSDDPDGRVTEFVYGVDSQPTAIRHKRLDNGVTLASRETTLDYFTTTDISNSYLTGRLKSVTNPENESIQFRYFADSDDFRFGKLYQVLDPRGNIVLQYDYRDDTDVRVKSETTYREGNGVVEKMKREYTYEDYPDTKITVTEEDLTGRSETATRETEYRLDYFYNVERVVETIGSQSRTFETHYLVLHPYRPHVVIDPNGNQEKYDWFAFNGKLSQYTDKENKTTNYRYGTSYPYLPFPDLITYPRVFDEYRYISRSLTMNYDAKNNVKLIAGSWPVSRRTFTIRNGTDHPETDGKIANFANAFDGQSSFDYYPNGNLQSVKVYGIGFTLLTEYVFEYDHFDNVKKITDGLGNETKFTYDNLDRLIEVEDARGVKRYFDYSDGFLETVGLPSNLGPSGPQSYDIGGGRQARSLDYSYNYEGLLERVEASTSSTTKEIRQETLYTGFNELFQFIRYINGSAKTTEWSYDQFGRNVKMTDSLGRESSTIYDLFCNENQHLTARGVNTTNRFDLLCRPLNIENGNGLRRYVYNDNDLLTDIIDEGGGARYGETGSNYNSADYATADRTWTIEYDLDNDMGPTRYTSPNGETIDVSMTGPHIIEFTDSTGLIQNFLYRPDLKLRRVLVAYPAVTNSLGQVEYFYDAAGRMEKIVYPTGLEARFDTGGGTPQSGWDEIGQLLQVRYVKSDGTLLRSFAYQYDDSGNRTSATESNGNPAQEVVWEYRYDWFDRLVQVKRGVGGATPSLQREYTYDESDNRVYVDDVPNNRTLWYSYKTVGSGPDLKYSDEIAEVQVASGTGKRMPADQADFSVLESIVSDADGNITSRTTAGDTTTYEWDDYNNLVKVTLPDNTVTEHEYNPNHIREEKKTDGDTFTTGILGVNETDFDGTKRSYILGHQVLGYRENGNFFFYIRDGLGSVRAILDSSYQEVESFDFDEFGNPLGLTPSSSKTYVGGLGVHNDLNETNLLYMQRRHYAPDLGRFISPDPIGLAGGSNLFSYGMNNPVTYTDHTGLQPGFPVPPSPNTSPGSKEGINLQRYLPFATLQDMVDAEKALPPDIGNRDFPPGIMRFAYYSSVFEKAGFGRCPCPSGTTPVGKYAKAHSAPLSLDTVRAIRSYPSSYIGEEDRQTGRVLSVHYVTCKCRTECGEVIEVPFEVMGHQPNSLEFKNPLGIPLI